MRTRFFPGRKGGEQEQENSLGLGLGVRSQGAHGFSGEGVERVLVAYGPERVVGLLWPTEWFRGGQHSRWRRGRVSSVDCVLGRGSRPGERRSISARVGSLGEVMSVSRVFIMIRHTGGCSSPVSVEKERFQGGTKPPRVLCMHASRPRAGGGALQERSSQRSPGRSGPIARQRSTLEDFLQA